MIPLASAPFVSDPQKSRMGQRMFAAMGCVSCHPLDGLAPMRKAKRLNELDPDQNQGCLSDTIRRGLPHYDWLIISALISRPPWSLMRKQTHP